MKNWVIVAVLFCFLLFGCAAMAEKNRLKSFSRINEAYEHALRMSDFDAAVKFLDPATVKNTPDLKIMKGFKIVEYRPTRVDVSENKEKITQDVELQYYRLNSNILRTVHDPQVWRFQQEDNIWRLQTGLPDLRP